MRPKEIAQTLDRLIPLQQPTFMWGPPGVGKSQLVRQAAERLGLGFIDIRAVLLDPVDLRGLPYVDKGTAKWAVPDFLPRKGEGVLLLDELPQSPQLTQGGLLQLTLERRLGEYTLPDGWSIIAAGNRSEDRAGGHRMITPLLNRFLHVDLEVHHEDWQEWALTNNIAPEIRSFLRFKPTLLHDFKPDTNPRAFPSPRSWAFVNKILPAAQGTVEHSVLSGCVGEGPASEFIAHRQLHSQLPDIDGLLADPKAGKIPDEPSVQYALCAAVAEKCRTADSRKLGNAAVYAGRMPKEFGILMMRDIMTVNDKALSTKEGAAWLKENRGLLLND
jgi:MoxR-like ATPase